MILALLGFYGLLLNDFVLGVYVAFGIYFDAREKKY